MRYVLGSRASIGGVLGSGRGGAGNGLLTGLVAYWGLDEAGGANNALDKHAGGLTLTQNNSPGADTGKVYATARTFNGSNQYFSRASETALQVGGSDWVIASWALLVSDQNGQIVGKYSTGDNKRSYEIGYLSASKRFYLYISTAGTAFTATLADNFGTPSLGTWYLVIAGCTGTTPYISVNNGTDNTGSFSGTLYNSDNAFTIGGRVGELNPISARLGPVAMWKNRTLDATSRAALWNGGAGLAYSAFS